MKLNALFLSVAIACAIVATPGFASTPAAGVSELAKTGVVALPDSKIEYFSQGEGPAIVLLPGGSLTVDYMAGLAQALDDARYRVVRINSRGAGKSIGPGENITLHTLAADVAGVIEALKIQPVVLAGHAFGNRVARQLAADRPELVSKVVLIAAGGKVAPEAKADAALGVIFNPASSEPEVLKAMEYMVGSPSDVPAAWRALRTSRAPRAAGLQRTAAMATPLAEWWAPAGDAQFLVLQGSNDRAAPPENGRLLQQELGGRVQLVELDGEGHLMFVTDPARTAREIDKFVRRSVP